MNKLEANIRLSSDMMLLTKDFLKQKDICLFGYHKVFRNGLEEIMVSNLIDWTDGFLHSDFNITGSFETEFGLDVNSMAVWPVDKDIEMLNKVKQITGINQGITLAFDHKDYYEYIGLGINSPYLFDLSKLINLIPDVTAFFKEIKYGARSVFSKQNDYYSIKPKVPPKRKQAYVFSQITRREFEILSLISENLTAKAIADKLFVSKRTIETHVEHLKNKLQCSSKNELMDFIRNNLNFL